MKKTMHDIFDEATSAELDHLIKQNDPPEVSEESRLAIQNKVYIKTRLTAPRKKRRIWIPYAVAACLCILVGIGVLYEAFVFDSIFDMVDTVISDDHVSDSKEDYGQNNNDGNSSGNQGANEDANKDSYGSNIGSGVDGNSPENGGLVVGGSSTDGNVSSSIISEQGTLIMTIVKTEPSAPAFEENCFYARDEYGRCCRVIWSDFEGLSEEDRIVVQYRNLKRLTYKEYWDGGWTPPYELTAVSVKRVQEDAALPTLTVKSGVVTVLVGEPYDIWERIVEAQNYTHVYYESSHPSVASVDGVGQVTIFDEKLVNIDVVAENEVGQTRVTIAIQAVFENPEVEVFAENVNLGIGEIYKLEEMIFTRVSEVVYESSNPEIATVDENGNITGVDEGSTTVQIYTVVGEKRYFGASVPVTVSEFWEPTNPISQEVLAAKESLAVLETFDWFLSNVSVLPEYNVRQDEDTTAGPVEIWNNTLQMHLTFRQDEVDTIITDDSNLYFDVYYRPYNKTNDRGDYKTAMLQPWSVYTYTLMVYHCKFYDQFFVENDGLLENQKYEVVIVIRQGDTQLGYAESEFTWTDSCAIFTEYAEAHPEIIK